MSKDEFYKILKVDRSATGDEIKQSFKKLAREHHPDKGGNTETFQQIQKAYETLSDPQRRKEYDSPEPRFDEGFPFDFNNFNSFFHQHHHQPEQRRQATQMSNHYYDFKISLKDVYFGGVRKIKVKRERLCLRCVQCCQQCSGRGLVRNAVKIGPFTQIIHNNCPKCQGSGDFFNPATQCTTCNSTHVIREERLIEINIQEGIESGHQFVFEEWGDQPKRSTDIPGCLIVTIQVEQHPHFERIGNHLKYTVNLSLLDQLSGRKSL